MSINEDIVNAIINMLDMSGGVAEIRRNTLASDLECRPSHISYVLASRFTPAQGYMVESRRGGGGYIKVTRITHDNTSATIMHIVNNIGDRLDFESARVIIKNIHSSGMISAETAKVMLAACQDSCYRSSPQEQRETLRAAIFKQMLISSI